MSTTTLSLDAATTALVVLDLQKGIVARPSEPRSSADVVKNAVQMAELFRRHKAQVILVHVAYRDLQDRLKLTTDTQFPISTPLPPDWSDIVPELGPKPGDILITKRQWGAFYGTELEMQLRRRGIKTLVLGGISTNFGVESTARQANEMGFEQIFLEDMMASASREGHEFTIKNILPRLGRVRSTSDLQQAFS